MSYVKLPAEEVRGKVLYKGYFNYRILTDKLFALKTHYFFNYPISKVKRMRLQFQNVKQYQFYGEKVTRNHEEERAHR